MTISRRCSQPKMTGNDQNWTCLAGSPSTWYLTCQNLDENLDFDISSLLRTEVSNDDHEARSTTDEAGNNYNSSFEHENFSQPDPHWRNLPVFRIAGVVEAPVPGVGPELAEAEHAIPAGLNLSPSEEILPGKKTRPRDKNWTEEETKKLLELMEEGLNWENISKRLKECYSISRSAQSCENRWGTLLKLHRDGKLLQVECSELMDRILGTKPRKKSGAGKKLKQPAVVDAANAGTSSTNPELLAPSANPPSDLQAATIASLTESFDAEDEGRGEQHETDNKRPGSLISEVSSLCEYLLQGQHSTNEQVYNMKEKALNLTLTNLELKILKETNKLKARECAERPRDRRPRKLSKKKIA